MDERLKKYVLQLFEAAPKSKAALELREELTANCIEKYNDLINQKIAEEDAYRIVIEGIGNVADLFQGLKEEMQTEKKDTDEIIRKRTAILTSASVGMYIVAAMVFLALSTIFEEGTFGLIAGIGISIVPTCILVYQAIAYPKYQRQEESIVESFKEWNHNSLQNKAVKGAVSSVLWTLCFAIYFLISFSTGAWHITWIIFLVCSCLNGIVNLLFCLKSENSSDNNNKGGQL